MREDIVIKRFSQGALDCAINEGNNIIVICSEKGSEHWINYFYDLSTLRMKLQDEDIYAPDWLYKEIKLYDCVSEDKNLNLKQFMTFINQENTSEIRVCVITPNDYEELSEINAIDFSKFALILETNVLNSMSIPTYIKSVFQDFGEADIIVTR